ncbi:response regulator [Aeromicrobium sp. CFBP 8757]|uniref:response regulator transcription factor n=1 Tax=Aeromicrobium sp. CFBP 8757 TaxID=2775288 RepID=UPI00177D4632|nr:response regulator transcription factor [Aeromicrobium sp. CFBP 8757]MBD8607569.1 response regulator [Aeromicrobium sp. CFBP 8757]
MIEGGEPKLAVIIEDDADVRHLLKTVLTQSGFQTILTTNGADGIEAVRTHDPILTTLDVSMPGMDGFAAAKRIREFSTTYIVMLTALADEIDIVQGLDSGADDYLLKPFRPRELRARIETMLRRPRDRAGVGSSAPSPSPAAASAAPARAAEPAFEQAPEPFAQPAQQAPPTVPFPVVEHPPVAPAEPAPTYAPPPAPPVYAPVPTPQHQAPQHPPAPDRPYRQPVQEPMSVAPAPSADGWLEHRGLQLNTQTRLVQVDARGVELTRSEFDLLATLMGSGRRVRSKADLVLALRGETYVTTYYVNDADKRAVEVHMANLRRKIGDSSATPRFIETVRGVGYRLASDREVG